MVLRGKGLTVLICFVAVALMAVLYLKLVKPLLAERKDVAKELKDAREICQKYRNLEVNPLGPPSKSLFLHLGNEKEALLRHYNHLIKELHLEKERLLPKDPEIEAHPEMYFPKELDRIYSESADKAESAGIKIPQWLGFSPEVPKPEDVRNLLRMLDVARGLVNLALQAQVHSVDAIEFSSPEEVDFLKALPLTLSLSSDMDSLIDLLYGMQSSSYFFSLEDLDLSSSPERGIKATIWISTIYKVEEGRDEA